MSQVCRNVSWVKQRKLTKTQEEELLLLNRAAKEDTQIFQIGSFTTINQIIVISVSSANYKNKTATVMTNETGLVSVEKTVSHLLCSLLVLL